MSRKTDRANEKLAEAIQQVENWKRREEELASELAGAEANVGSAALESGDLEGSASAVASLREQFNAARSTVVAAEAQKLSAQREAWRAEAEDCRREAKQRKAEAEKHAARTSALLADLEEHEGGPYVPEQPIPGIADSRPVWTPRSNQLMNQAAGLEQKAAELEKRAAAPPPNKARTRSEEAQARAGG